MDSAHEFNLHCLAGSGQVLHRSDIDMEKTLPNRAIEWQQGQLTLLDQRCLPNSIEFLQIHDASEASDAIKQMVVRGAPAIGITAAYAIVLSAMNHTIQNQQQTLQQLSAGIEADMQMLAAARPTAVNLIWAIERMQTCMNNCTQNLLQALEAEAIKIHQEDIAANNAMGELGAQYIGQNVNVMTHCNAGALATGGYGTALGVIRTAFSQGKINTVFANETRPWFQGARLTAWELLQEKIPVSLICDAAAASALYVHDVEWIIVGADRVAANGDVANKIGTYGLAALAKHAGKKFMVVAPTSTIDLDSASGDDITIEQRASHEVTHVADKSIASAGVNVWNPVFDVTPAALVDVLVTEQGVIEKPSQEKIAQLFAKPRTK